MKSHASMNRFYRLVWNAALNLWMAVAENARGRGKGGRQRTVPVALALPLLAALAPQALAADAANATISAGTGSVVTSGNTTTITQGSGRLAIDWTSLSTRANEALVFNQPGAQAIALNRITGSSPSELLGSLTANGQVFILNPNGVLFGAGSQVNVGGLVASTMNLSNADFLAGNYRFTGNGGGSVVNQGTLNAAPGGYLALLAPEVRNEGVMTATLGTALLAAGNKVTLNLDNGSLVGYSIDQGAINALAENRQLIQANGGQVLLSAKAMDSLTAAAVNNSGVIEARTVQNKAGRILLMGDMVSGTVNVGGTLDASAPNGGNGGFIETSAAHVKVADDVRVTTQSTGGTTGKWLIDPNDFTIAAGGDMTGTAIGNALATTNVDIETATMGHAGSGDINILQSISRTSGAGANTLTLIAERDINVNSNITSTSAPVNVVMNAGRSVSGPGTLNLNGGNLNVTATQDIYLAQVYANSVNMTATNGAVTGDAGTDWRANSFNLVAGTNINSNGLTNSPLILIPTGAGATLNAYAGTTGNGSLNIGVYGNSLSSLTLRADRASSGGDVAFTSDSAVASASITAGADISASTDGNFNITGLNLMGSAQSVNLGAGSGTLTLPTISDASVNLTASGGSLNLGDLSVRNATLSGSNGLTLASQIVVGQNINLSSSNGAINQTAGALVISIGTTANAAGAINLTQTGNYLSGAVNASNTGASNIDLYSGSTRLVLGTVSAGGNLTAGSSSGIRLTGGTIQAGSTQTYNNAVTLVGNTVLGNGTATGGDINFLSTVNGAFQLKTSVAGSTNFSGVVGGTNALASLVIDGAASTSVNVNSSGAQTYGGTLTSNGATLNAGSISLNGLSGSGVTLNASGAITNTGATNITGIFNLQAGTWSQLGSSLPTFSATDFRISGGTFLRALGGDGASSATAYRIGDVYGLQGAGSAGMLGKSYLLASNVDASGTASWNGGVGFTPIGNATTTFTGNFDGGYHTVTGLTINRSQDYTGLFGWIAGTVGNLGLAGVNIRNSANFTGALAGVNSGVVSNSYAAGTVSGVNVLGGLVGYNPGGTIGNSYSAASVTGNQTVGGLVGDNSIGHINNSYAMGGVTGNTMVGGLVGNTPGSSSNSFWNTDTTGQSGSSTGTGKTTAQMQQAATFTGAGWNASNTGGDGTTWRIYEGQTGPLLRGFLTQLDLGNTVVTYNGAAQSGGTSALAGVSGTNASGRNAGSYTSTYYSNQQGYDISGGGLTINRANLTIGTADVVKTYDGTTTASTTAAAVAGTTVQSGDSLTGGTFAFTDKNFGVGNKTVAVTAGSVTVNDGNGGNNYNISYADNTTSTINKAALTVTANGVTKTYDGTTSATGTGTVGALAGAGAGESVNSVGSQAFLDKSAGTGNKTVRASGVTIQDNGNADVTGNYDITYVDNTTSTINKAALTVTANGVTKTYDGTTSATGTGTAGTLAGAGAGESVNSAGIQAFLDKNAGTGNKSVRASGVTIKDNGNADVTGNYDITYVDNTSSTINQATLVLSTGNVSKTYDGTTSAAGTATAVAGTAIQTGDSLSGGTFAFTDKNVGTGNKTVTVSNVTVNDGNGGNNYAISYVDNTTSTIGKAGLTVTALGLTKTYDGGTTASGAGIVGFLAGAGAGETVNSAGSQAFLDKNAGTGNKTVRASGVTIQDNTSADVTGNYDITYIDNTTSTINKASLTVTLSASGKTYDGTTAVSATYGSNVISGDAVTISGSASFADKNVGPAKTVNATGIAISGGDAANYDLTGTTATTTAAITPKTLTVTANNDTKLSGSAYSGGNGVRIDGFATGDSASLLTGTLAYGGSSQGASAAGRYDITPGGLFANSNYALVFTSGVLTLTPGGSEASVLGGNTLVDAYRGVMGTLGQPYFLGGQGNDGGPEGRLNAAAAESGQDDE